MLKLFAWYSFFLVAPVLLALAGPLRSWASEEQGRPALASEDCAKCHPLIKATISSRGRAHRDKVGCLDCHGEHPPWGNKVIPKCRTCHEDRDHFKAGNCLACHADPHAPLDFRFAEDVTPGCCTCHVEEGLTFDEYPSKHARLPCNRCHEVHGRIPDCLQCHAPHLDGIAAVSGCRNCHSGHRPLNVRYTITTPMAVCTSCHGELAETLSRNNTKHGSFSCAFCHRTIHRIIPRCRTCHGEPHSFGMHRTWPRCQQCHQTAHTLVL